MAWKIYRRLLLHFGPQGWWPTTPRGAPKPCYHPGRTSPPDSREALEICLGAILTQNTAWRNVERALANLTEALGEDLSPRAVKAIGRRRLERLIRPSGYFRQKAGRLLDFCDHVLREADGRVEKLLEGLFEERRSRLLDLKGVGPETADSMLLYAGGRPVFVVDAYTRRIADRTGLCGSPDYHALQAFFTERLPRSEKVFQEYHALLVALAKDFCRKTPVCAPCPIRDLCATGKHSGHST